MQKYNVWREGWWEATRVGDLKGVRMGRYNIGRKQWWEVTYVEPYNCLLKPWEKKLLHGDESLLGFRLIFVDHHSIMFKVYDMNFLWGLISMMKEEYRGECDVGKDLKYVRPRDPSRTLDVEIHSFYLYSAVDFLHVEKLLNLHNRKAVSVCLSQIYYIVNFLSSNSNTLLTLYVKKKQPGIA